MSSARHKKEHVKKVQKKKKNALFKKIVISELYEEYDIPLVCITLVKLDEVKQLSDDEKNILSLIWHKFDETAQAVKANTMHDA